MASIFEVATRGRIIMSHKLNLAILALCLLTSVVARGQAVEVDDKLDGKAKAAKYFKARKGGEERKPTAEAPASSGSNAHYLALHLGMYIDDQAYNWSSGNQSKVGNVNLGVTYRIGEWINSADFMVRSEYSSYSLDDGDARKLNFLTMIMFPDSSSKFPLYFGAGVGPGFYLKQLHGKSAMSLDYQLVAGVRFLNVIDNLGFLGEFGIKNDVQLFSAGQFNGLFAGVGVAWVF
jgi:hypothetical protein